MIKHQIRTWLSGEGSFRDGVHLLELAGSNSARAHRPLLNGTYIQPHHKKRLRADLTRVLGRLPEDSGPPPTSFTPEPVKPTDTPQITALRGKGVMLLKERSGLKEKLLLMALDDPEKYTDEDRHEVARQIMAENVPALDDTYGNIRRFEEEGIEPAGDAERIRQEAIDQVVEYKNLAPRINRAKTAQKDDLVKELEARRDELHALLWP